MEALKEIESILQAHYEIGKKKIDGTVTKEDIDSAPSLSRTITVMLAAIIELDERTKKD